MPSLPAPNPFGAPSLNIRTFDMPLIGEDRLYNHKLAAVMAYARANGLNRVTHPAAQARLAIVAAGKAYQDVLQAVMELGWDDAQLAAIGIRIAKVGMLWPLDPEFVREAAQNAAMLVVVVLSCCQGRQSSPQQRSTSALPRLSSL